MAYDNFLVDKRIVERNITKGLVDADELKRQIESLPDCESNCVHVSLDGTTAQLDSALSNSRAESRIEARAEASDVADDDDEDDDLDDDEDDDDDDEEEDEASSDEPAPQG